MVKKLHILTTLGAFALIYFILLGQLKSQTDLILKVHRDDSLEDWSLSRKNGTILFSGPLTEMADPRLLSKIAAEFILDPPLMNVSYVLNHPETGDTSKGRSREVLFLLKNKTNGFFIEYGAKDGEHKSNTLFMERRLNWTGLLIEAVPSNFERLLKKKRKAYISNAYVGKTPYPMKVRFKVYMDKSRTSNLPPGNKEHCHVEVQSFPLYSFLLALNRTSVDFLSLDTGGSYIGILKTIPFDKVDIKVISVDVLKKLTNKHLIRKFMREHGYRVHTEVYTKPRQSDFIFVKQ